jgi:hypothetical protein
MQGDIEPEGYEKLIIDQLCLSEGIKAEDKEFLAKFTIMTKLSMNSTNLKSLDNMPEAKLQKLEISDNKIKEDEL